MKVKELIVLLKTFDEDLEVVYQCFSEQCLLNPDELKVDVFCEARVDGWVQNARPDQPSKPYLVFPGN